MPTNSDSTSIAHNQIDDLHQATESTSVNTPPKDTQSDSGTSVTQKNRSSQVRQQADRQTAQQADSCSTSNLPAVTQPHTAAQPSRLLHFIQEPNVGRGFIKELSFSHDGRLLSSPFAFGIRLLAFNSTCSELSDCEPEQAVQLHEVQ